ncbi:MAG: BCAM0308 family protein [Thermodesulfobacteriaceae bacterium]|nr:BCAM0308 family protein [Thermodesulfobacteriaceae bacterium]MCX8041153.1 BCAM0308 family protein [Thermodesulfobacteriaceae bacterium]MDW8135797.1 BCAM0308 family protein [Thermodesulfobacterium sp.]
MAKKGDKWIRHTWEFETSEDPYAMKSAPSGEAICPRCKAIFKDKRWFTDEELYEELKETENVPHIICPGCRKALEQYAMGYLYLSGNFWKTHKEEIMKLINNEYEKARGLNPLHQIISIYEEAETTVIETTTDQLAQRFGRALYRAYKGELEFKWSKGDKLVRVYWSREK